MDSKIQYMKSMYNTVVAFTYKSDDYAITTDDEYRIIIYKNDEHFLHFTAHKSTISTIKTYYKNDEIFIVSGSYDNTIKIWTLDGNCVKTLNEHINWVVSISIYEECGTIFIISLSYDKTIKIWKDTGKCVRTIHLPDPYKGNITTFYKDKIPFIAAANGDGKPIITIYCAIDGKIIHKLKGHTKAVFYVETSIYKNKLCIVSGSADNTVKIWDIDSYECIKTLIGHAGAITCIKNYNYKNNSYLISVSRNKTTMLFDLYNETQEIFTAPDGINSIDINSRNDKINILYTIYHDYTY